jgi:hypothetical protein
LAAPLLMASATTTAAAAFAGFLSAGAISCSVRTPEGFGYLRAKQELRKSEKE